MAWLPHSSDGKADRLTVPQPGRSSALFAGRPGRHRQGQDVTIRVKRIADAFTPGPIPQALKQRAAAFGRAGQRRRGIGAAQVKLTSLAGAGADLTGQKFGHIGGRHQPQRRPAQVELGYARHIQHRLGS